MHASGLPDPFTIAVTTALHEPAQRMHVHACLIRGSLLPKHPCRLKKLYIGQLARHMIQAAPAAMYYIHGCPFPEDFLIRASRKLSAVSTASFRGHAFAHLHTLGDVDRSNYHPHLFCHAWLAYRSASLRRPLGNASLRRGAHTQRLRAERS